MSYNQMFRSIVTTLSALTLKPLKPSIGCKHLTTSKKMGSR